MRIPVQLSKGLTDKNLGQLESQLKRGILAKQLRVAVKEKIEQSYVEEESIIAADPSAYLKAVGERRGLRQVLNLLPEE